MTEIANSISTDTSPATKAFNKNLKTFANGMFDSIKGEFDSDDIDSIVNKYLKQSEPTKAIASLESKYVIPKDTFKTAYAGLLKGLLQAYITAYQATNTVMTNIPDNIDLNSVNLNSTDLNSIDLNSVNLNSVDLNNIDLNSISTEMQNVISSSTVAKNESSNDSKVKVDKDIKNTVMKAYMESVAIQKTVDTMGTAMTEAKMKKEVLTKVGELTAKLTSSFATAFNVDEEKIASSFKMKMTEEEITRIVTAMLSETETNAKTNLISFGYQDKEEPTYISFYFRSFDGKERFKDFIASYNTKVKEVGDEDKEINYTDTTGILMGSVKTIVNAVTYVLIAFISISLVVSSIMIGIITYISVLERIKEIGILRAIGASKKDISRVFNAETFIVGLLAGAIGIGVTLLLIFPANAIIKAAAGVSNLAKLPVGGAIGLIIISMVLTVIAGLIPAKMAAKKDPVEALRTE